MKNSNKILLYLPAVVVLVVHAIIVAVSYSGLPAEVPTKFHKGEAIQLMPRWTVWISWVVNVVICALVAISSRIPAMRSNIFRVKLWNRKVINAQDVLSPNALEILYSLMTFVISLLFIFVSCSIIFPSLRMLMQILLSTLAALVAVGSFVFAICVTKRERE